MIPCGRGVASKASIRSIMSRIKALEILAETYPTFVRHPLFQMLGLFHRNSRRFNVNYRCFKVRSACRIIINDEDIIAAETDFASKKKLGLVSHAPLVASLNIYRHVEGFVYERS
ncbi:hypothetical protein D9757_012486 [Collybiopsis confluens]|uniref:Uncharacterized protein n=1 Tax=Collybiopsis confluens TaxID=2823264 RepID=A0A8H5LPJ5_9AGAR|nr:hypothetical protein D9757_012486 [Collybiopsis confluens]